MPTNLYKAMHYYQLSGNNKNKAGADAASKLKLHLAEQEENRKKKLQTSSSEPVIMTDSVENMNIVCQ